MEYINLFQDVLRIHGTNCIERELNWPIRTMTSPRDCRWLIGNQLREFGSLFWTIDVFFVIKIETGSPGIAEFTTDCQLEEKPSGIAAINFWNRMKAMILVIEEVTYCWKGYLLWKRSLFAENVMCYWRGQLLLKRSFATGEVTCYWRSQLLLERSLVLQQQNFSHLKSRFLAWSKLK